MRTKALRDDGEIPAGMKRVCRCFERWRNGHKARLPIPEGLWASAAQAAREHGVFRTAKILRLEYAKLKRMVESAPARGKATAGHNLARTTFLELVPPPAASLADYLIELEGPRGKMRIQWKGTTAPDLAGLSRVLWESA
jgi:hypothetical protein